MRSFSDLNNDGCLTYKDFLWAKDKICYMSGWKIDSPKYKITEALFHEIWESLEIIADVDKDGKITKTEWVIKAFYLFLPCICINGYSELTNNNTVESHNKWLWVSKTYLGMVTDWNMCAELLHIPSGILYLSHSNKHSFCLLCKYLEAEAAGRNFLLLLLSFPPLQPS